MPIVDCENIVKTYRQGEVTVNALRNVSLSIDNGEFVALAGPSGSGKTTLLNMIGSLDQADSGKISVAGNDFGHMSPSELADLRLRKLGFVFQAYNLIPVLSAVENVEYVMLLQGVPPKERIERAKTILDDVGLEDKYDRRPAELSGGMRKRVGLARAIASEPEVLLYDEPTTGLDPITADMINDLIVRLNDKLKITSVAVTHDMTSAYKIADRVVMLYRGKVEFDGSPEEVRTTDNPVVRQFTTGSADGPIQVR